MALATGVVVATAPATGVGVALGDGLALAVGAMLDELGAAPDFGSARELVRGGWLVLASSCDVHATSSAMHMTGTNTRGELMGRVR